ncbi:glycine cleavage H-protein [Helicosporidium sp. ATCC 50920]|nr:glycine cleavage H-protein [Helicosporidium sp. ATCC 50920]|eukprot:KDD76175.1 glycine cleavage H-protein [Helicosporidium sp. ATCC 50920]
MLSYKCKCANMGWVFGVHLLPFFLQKMHRHVTFTQAELGDVVYVELPEVGSTLNKGETFGVVESVKAASDIYAPLSGEVIEVNNTLTEEPGLVNSSPYEEGWIAKIKLSNAEEAAELKDAAAYSKHCESAGH